MNSRLLLFASSVLLMMACTGVTQQFNNDLSVDQVERTKNSRQGVDS